MSYITIANILRKMNRNFIDESEDIIYIYDISGNLIISGTYTMFRSKNEYKKYLYKDFNNFYIEYVIDHKNIIFELYISRDYYIEKGDIKNDK